MIQRQTLPFPLLAALQPSEAHEHSMDSVAPGLMLPGALRHLCFCSAEWGKRQHHSDLHAASPRPGKKACRAASDWARAPGPAPPMAAQWRSLRTLLLMSQ